MSILATTTPAVAARDQTAALGTAAERFARTTLRRSAQTQRTYAGAYRRFTTWLTACTGDPDPPLSALTADALAAYLDKLEDQGRAPGTIKKERAALNHLAKYLHTLGVIDATAILLVEGTALNDRERTRDALDREPGTGSRRSPARASAPRHTAARPGSRRCATNA